MNKELEKILFKTIEEAIEYGADHNRYGEFDFSELYNAIKELTKTDVIKS